VFTWLLVILVSIPWLSLILVISFTRTTRTRKVSMVNAWTQFVLTKILKIELRDDSKIEACGSRDILNNSFDNNSTKPECSNPPPYIFMCLNREVSLLESLLLLPAAFPPKASVFLFANLEFLMVPLLGWVFWKTLQSEMVIRQNQTQARGALKRAIDRMKFKKSNMLISIEGKRSENGYLSTYKRGPALIAIQTKATIIPIVMFGTREIWPYGDWKIRRGGTVTVKFLTPIPTRTLTADDRFMLTEKLKRLANSELAAMKGERIDEPIGDLPFSTTLEPDFAT